MSERDRTRLLADYKAFYQKQQLMWQAMFLFKEYGARYEREMWRREEVEAAIQIQALARGRAKRKFVQELRAHRQREFEDDMALFEDCACSIQAAWRGHRVRQVLRPVIESRMDEYIVQRAASTIQRYVRGSTTRHLVAAMRKRRAMVEKWMDAALRSMGINPTVKQAADAFASALAVDGEVALTQAELLRKACIDLLSNVSQLELIQLFSPTEKAPIQLQALAGAVCEVFSLPPSMTSARSFFQAENALEVLVAMTPQRISERHNYVIRSLMRSQNILEFAKTADPPFMYVARWISAVIGVSDPVLLDASRGAKAPTGPIRAVSSRQLIPRPRSAAQATDAAAGGEGKADAGAAPAATAHGRGGKPPLRGGRTMPSDDGVEPRRREESKGESKRGSVVRRSSTRRLRSSPRRSEAKADADADVDAGARAGAGGGVGAGGTATRRGHRNSAASRASGASGKRAEDEGGSVGEGGGVDLGVTGGSLCFSIHSAGTESAQRTPRAEPERGFATSTRIRTPRAERRAVALFKLPAMNEDVKIGAMQARKIRVYITTFNLSGKAPPTDFKVLMPESDYHMYWFGFQHLPQQAQAAHEEAATSAAPKLQLNSEVMGWIANLDKAVGTSYSKIVSPPFGNMIMIGYLHSALSEYLRQSDGAPPVMPSLLPVSTPAENGGVQRGAVALRFQLGNTKFMFVCSHLPDTTGDTAETRLQNQYMDTIDRDMATARTLKMRHHKRGTGEHDNVFWFGSLNYPVEADFAEAKAGLLRGRYKKLLQRDMLRKSIQMRAVPVLTNLMEKRAELEPTYPFEVGTDDYDVTGGKVPIWADRILFTPGMTPHFYATNMDVRTSEHKPVSAGFSCPWSCDNRVEDVGSGVGDALKNVAKCAIM